MSAGGLGDTFPARSRWRAARIRIIVTGATGFIGEALLAQLRSEYPAAEIVAPVRRQPRQEWAGVRYMAGVPEGDVLFHLAGSAGIEASLADPQGDLADNAGTALESFAAAVGSAATVVLASSCAVYGDVPMPAREDGPTRPQSPYGVSKLAAEEYALMYLRSTGLDVRIARIGNPYGPKQRRHAVYDLARRALADGRLVVRGDGSEVRDFIHVADVARALLAVAERGRAGEVYNLASGTATSILSLAQMIAGAAGVTEPVGADGAVQPGKVRVFLPSVERLRSLGFATQWALEAGIEETVAWVAESS